MFKNSKFLRMTGLLSILLVFAITTYNCNRANKTLAEIGDEKITLGEFEKQYLKTVSSVDSAKIKSIEEKRNFLNLYINFRLKVKDARERGLLNNPDIQKDIADYKKNFAPTFLIDKEVVNSEIKKLYERKKDEVRASHILLALNEHAPAADSIAAYQKADTIIQKLDKGESFETLAEQYSQDRTVKQNRGDLYYFTGGMTVAEFEDAVYDLKVGDYTKKPVRSPFGLHIIKLTDRKPRLDQIRASHILIQDKRDSLGKVIDSVQTYQKALEVYNKAKNGEDFSALAQQFTDDPGTKTQGGDLGFFDRRRLTQPVDSAVFMMKVGDVAGPVRSSYGWHILKKTDEKPLQPFDKQKEALKTEFKRTKAFKDLYESYVDDLQKKYNYKVNDETLAFMRAKFDSSKTVSDYNMDSVFTPQDKERVVASYDGGKISISDLLNHLNVNRDYQRSILNLNTFNSIIKSSSEQAILNKRAAESNIEKDDDYIASLREYENGLLVFRVDQDELWSKVKISDNDMKSFYDGNKSKYMKADSTGKQVPKQFDEVKAEISNELQQVKFKDTEKAYLDALRQKYPVKINEDVLLEAFKD
jgi:peptidyl-prolyl cis-trans isomerase SurA